MDGSGRPPGDAEPPRSDWADLGGRVHFADYGGPGAAPLVVLVHGLGGSLRSWAGVAPVLARSARVLAIDLAGFGLSRDSGLPVSLPANARLLHRFLTRVAGTPAVLVGHSMGGTVAAMQASLHPSAVAGLVLVNPVVPWVRDELEQRMSSVLAAASQALRPGDRPRSPRPAGPGLAGTVSRAASDPRPPLPALPAGRYSVVSRDGVWARARSAEAMAAGRSLTWTLLRRQQFADMLSGIAAPVLWLHGEQDPLIPVRAARKTVRDKPSWTFRAGPGIGHEPHREAPDWTAGCVRAWLGAEGAPAADLAREARPPGAGPA